MAAHKTSWLPELAAATGAILGGSAVVATRFGVGEGDPLIIAFLRHYIAAVILLPLALYHFRFRLRIAPADVLPLVALALIQFALFGWLFAASLSYIPAARGSIVLATMPLLTLTLASVLGLEQLTRAKLAGVAIAFAAIAIALGERAHATHPQAWLGDLLMVTAALAGSIYNALAGIYLRRYPALVVTGLSVPIGAVGLAVAVTFSGQLGELAQLSTSTWLASAYLGSIGGAVCFFLWIWALERTTPTRVAVMVTLNPLSSALIAWLALSEPITLRIIIGLVGVMGGIALANWRPRPAPATVVAPEPLPPA